MINIKNKIYLNFLKIFKKYYQYKKIKQKNLILISMIKDEIDIIETFIIHHLDLFDKIILIDHNSTDGTRELMIQKSKINPKIHLHFNKAKNYNQADIINKYTDKEKNKIDKKKQNWIFYLDADEFLPFNSRILFENALHDYEKYNVIHMPWKNIIPTKLKEFSSDQLFYIPRNNSPIFKVALNLNKIKKNTLITQGAHFVLNQNLSPFFKESLFYFIYHLPIRNLKQFELKIKNGVKAYEGEKSKNGYHWFFFEKQLQNKKKFNNYIYSFIINYSLINEKQEIITKSKLFQTHFQSKIFS